jgi:hypothetical protein
MKSDINKENNPPNTVYSAGSNPHITAKPYKSSSNEYSPYKSSISQQ